jgi:hypothetical protein
MSVNIVRFRLPAPALLACAVAQQQM